MKKARIILMLLLPIVIFFASCDKETKDLTGGAVTTPPPPPPPLSPPDSLYRYSWYNYNGSGTGLWAISGLGNVFGNIVSKFDSAFYNDHVQVYLKFVGSASWRNIPYVAHDLTGQNGYDLYFTDNNYTISFPFFGTAIVARIVILAKPTAGIDFSKKVDVSIVVH